MMFLWSLYEFYSVHEISKIFLTVFRKVPAKINKLILARLALKIQSTNQNNNIYTREFNS